MSSHDVGVFDALMMAKELGSLPEVMELYGIEIGTDMPGKTSSEAVITAAEDLAGTIVNLVQGRNRR
jgi:Ni,Fe-hydrogenase maturation factor